MAYKQKLNAFKIFKNVINHECSAFVLEFGTCRHFKIVVK